MPRLTLDGKEIEVEPGSTVLDGARGAGIPIPTLCHGEGLPHFSSCMVCAVKDRKAGRFIPACEAEALESMAIDASSEEVISFRREALSLLLQEHAGDCEAPCSRACPAGLDVPGLMRRLRRGDFEDGLRLALEGLPLPGVLGRICPAPCEKVCRRALMEGSVSIRRLHGFVAERDLEGSSPWTPDGAATTGKVVTVVGAGAAGLSAAWFLLRRSHEVRIVEALGEGGGRLREEYDPGVLPRAVLNGEIERIEKLGASIRTDTKLGSEVSLEELRGESDAVVLALGKADPGEMEPLGLRVSEKGIEVESGTHRTNLPDVFAVGDAVRPGLSAVRAVGQGRSAAVAVGRFLAGGEAKEPDRRFHSRLGRLSEAEVEAFLAGRAGRPALAEDPAFPEPDEARGEAGRCLECDCRRARDCGLRSLAERCGAELPGGRPFERKRYAPVLRLGRVSYEPGKCILCGLCVRITAKQEEEAGLAFTGRGFDTKVAVPLADAPDSALKRSAEACVKACPTGALVFAAPAKDAREV
ncbi:MAG: 2Fe-2S iron-sulfur cluster-binding protein [Planctomycetota bacterium]|jgi:NADPH-dependent 2,4-dienoyl-CoA reductase/sulfur reductase-like enzyme/ferredoxin